MPITAEIRKQILSLFGAKAKRGTGTGAPPSPPALISEGACPVCSEEVIFVAHHPPLRDNFRCASCGSIPRERALMATLESYFPDWRDRVIHESSPGDHGASRRLARECRGYIASHYLPGVAPGRLVGAVRCENLQDLSFADASIDLHVTQDVIEHVFHPARVFREIARTLKPGGAHVFTVPLVRRHEASRARARLDEGGRVVHLEPPEYHGNPTVDEGSLVTMDWGFDICRHIFEASGLFTHVVQIDDLSRGIRAEYIEVLVTVKPAVSPAPVGT